MVDSPIVEYFEHLGKELLEGELRWLLVNLSYPVRFIFPSYEQIIEQIPECKSTTEELGFVNKIVDINVNMNSRDAGNNFDLRQKYNL